MDCKGCNNTITPGMVIVVDELSGEWIHCPYCLQLLKPDKVSQEVENNNTSGRDEMRRKVRERFINRLIEQSHDGKLHCPVCSHNLNKNDEQLLREGEYFKCHLCGHDLATFAYREEAYHEQRWLPVVYALSDLMTEKECNGCSHIGAIAKACQKAFSWIPGSELKLHGKLKRILSRSQWKEPTCDWESCIAVRQYRKLAGEGLLLL